MAAITPSQLDRLIAIDAALAGPGLNRRTMARRLRVSTKTIQRDHELIRAVTDDAGVSARTPTGVLHFHRYRSRRVFSRWLADSRADARKQPRDGRGGQIQGL